MCFIFASQQAVREPLPNNNEDGGGGDCQFCGGKNCIDRFQEKRITYLYGCCPTKPKLINGNKCRQFNKEWYQGDVQEVVYTQTQQPNGVVVVTGKAVTPK